MSNLMSMLSSFSNTSTGSRTKESYTLDQVLTIIVLRKKNLSAEAISKVVGHTKLSITYKIGWITKKVKQHGDDTFTKIYEEFKVSVPTDLEADVTSRVENLIENQAAA